MFPYQLVFLGGLAGLFLVVVAVANTASVIAERLSARKQQRAAVVGQSAVKKAA